MWLLAEARDGNSSALRCDPGAQEGDVLHLAKAGLLDLPGGPALKRGVLPFGRRLLSKGKEGLALDLDPCLARHGNTLRWVIHILIHN